jgi:hypothetical protein
LANGLERLLSAADRTYAQYASLQHWQAEISGDTYSDWNMKTGQIESGRQWKLLLGYTLLKKSTTALLPGSVWFIRKIWLSFKLRSATMYRAG